MGSNPGVRIEQSAAGAMAIVTAFGELDHGAVGPLNDTIDAALSRSPLILAVDLRAATFVDCGTVGELVAVARRCEASGCRLLLVRGSAQVDRLLTACGLQGRFDVVESLDQLPGGGPTGRFGLEPA